MTTNTIYVTPSPANNSRFKDLGGGHISEMISVDVHIRYDPNSENSHVLFMGSPHVMLGDLYRRIDSEQEAVGLELASIMNLQPLPPGTLDPITGQDISGISMAGIGMVIKGVYNFAHNVQNGTPGYEIPGITPPGGGDEPGPGDEPPEDDEPPVEGEPPVDGEEPVEGGEPDDNTVPPEVGEPKGD